MAIKEPREPVLTKTRPDIITAMRRYLEGFGPSLSQARRQTKHEVEEHGPHHHMCISCSTPFKAHLTWQWLGWDTGLRKREDRNFVDFVDTTFGHIIKIRHWICDKCFPGVNERLTIFADDGLQDTKYFLRKRNRHLYTFYSQGIGGTIDDAFHLFEEVIHDMKCEFYSGFYSNGNDKRIRSYMLTENTRARREADWKMMIKQEKDWRDPSAV